MKVNLDTTSKRALAILGSPKFKNTDIDSDFEIHFDSNDKILTVYHDGKNGEIELLFDEVLSVFAKNRTIEELWKINFREIENFLRDENHLQALSEDMLILEEILNKRKISLISEAIKNRSSETIYTLIEMFFDWRNLSLVSKNQWAHEFLNIIRCELIFCNEDTLTLRNSSKVATSSDLEALIIKILGVGENIPSLKVVAVQ